MFKNLKKYIDFAKKFGFAFILGLFTCLAIVITIGTHMALIISAWLTLLYSAILCSRKKIW